MPSRPPGGIGTHNPIKPLTFYQSSISAAAVPTSSALDDGGDGWWSGVQQLALSTALTVALSFSASASASQAFGQWQDETVPQAAAFAPDEDFWNKPTVSSSQAFVVPPQSSFDSQEPTLFGQPDEDFWGVPAPTAQQNVIFAFNADEVIVSQPVLFAPDENFWQNAITPAQQTFVVPLQSSFDSPEPTLYGQFDEDFWTNPVAPIQATLGKAYLPDQEEIPALAATVDEYLWTNQAAPVPAVFGRLYSPDQEEMPTLHGQYDEDFWANPVAPAQATLGGLYLPDSEEIPANSLTATVDEYLWQNSVAPVAGSLYQRLPYWFDGVESPTVFQPEEDFWQQLVAPSLATLQSLQQWSFDEQSPFSAPSNDDFWSNPVASIPLTFSPVYLPDPEAIPPLSAGFLDESVWVPGFQQMQTSWIPVAAFTDDEIIVFSWVTGASFFGRSARFGFGTFR